MQARDSKRLIAPRRVHTVVIGAGQAGLAVGYYLLERGIQFVILDANDRVGDSWRNRWDSLRLFTSAGYDSLPGMPFPAGSRSFPTKDEMADYLEAYATRFNLPVVTRTRVDRLWKTGDRYVVDTGELRIEADNVVLAMSTFQEPKIPPFAKELAPHITQLHSRDYRNPGQLRPGGVLVVGAGNSGAEIAIDLARVGDGREIWLSGRHPGNVPFKNDGAFAHFILKPILLRFIFHRVLTIDTPIGRRVRPKALKSGAPLIRVKPADLDGARIQRVPRMLGVEAGHPALEDRTLLDVANVIWCTGFTPGFGWVDLPVFATDGEPAHHGGLADGEAGVSFVGLHFLYAMSSTMIHGVGRDAKRIVDAIAARQSGSATDMVEPQAAQRAAG